MGWRNIEAKYAKDENRKNWPCLTKGAKTGSAGPKATYLRERLGLPRPKPDHTLPARYAPLPLSHSLVP